MKIISFQRTILFVVLALCTIFAVIFFSHVLSARQETFRPAYVRDSGIDYKKATDFWGVRIHVVGATRAYQEMTNEGNVLSASQAHVLAHSFGDALFRAESVEGLSVCGSQFVYGCYHQLIADAIAAFGLTILGEFRADCAQKSKTDAFSCQHGVGHGILGYLGYSQDDLDRALVLCDVSDDPLDSSRACADGVFMEYNLRELTTYDSGKLTPRTFSSNALYTPCFDVPKTYRDSCIHELPTWWIAAMPDTSDGIEGRFLRAGTYCAGLNSAGFVRKCFEGIGHIVPPLANLDPDASMKLCEAASHTSDERLSCLSAAVRRFRVEGVSGYVSLCEKFGLSGDSLAYCRTLVMEPAI